MKSITANKKNLTERDVFFFTVMFIFICFIGFKTGVSTSPDDVSYLTALNNAGYIDYFWKRYNSWSGRVAVEFLAVSIMPYTYALKMLVVSCYILLSYSVWRITLSERISYHYGMPLVIMLTLMINPSVSAEAVYWAAGAFNYLVPASLGLFSVCVLMNQDAFSAKLKVISILSLIVSSNSEQCAIILLTISFLNLTLTIKRGLSLYSLFYYIANIVSSLILFLSPGAHKRFAIESGKFMPNFVDFSFLQKLSFGIDRYVSGIFDSAELLFTIASLLILLVTINKSGWVFRALRASFAIFILSKLVILNSEVTQQLSPQNWLSNIKYIYFSIAAAHASLMLICTLESGMPLKIKTICAFCLIMGAAITVAIGLSPTVYASSQRVIFFSEISMVIFICSGLAGVRHTGAA
ncbi:MULTISPECIES: DUF6056 family protein [unclassified Pantoea]|uniref:DUF6056 family protein n=1 Tax=unclassified Pantoea TaxID=2630326 RepID=UPI0012329B4F|nr:MULTISPECIES: DUF6056 family protein [unclassified Pantoea]KAA5974845.1 hypothetical protein F3I51_02850 [Pantoea sp. M_6]KAA5979200.1 hypothetical protein F3I52_04415 [Pantoea sp. M_8]KAA5992026.1 hypothetical protein F3I47_09200 [Pantoea sp. M_10]